MLYSRNCAFHPRNPRSSLLIFNRKNHCGSGWASRLYFFGSASVGRHAGFANRIGGCWNAAPTNWSRGSD
jgi:hypothetical protein